MADRISAVLALLRRRGPSRFVEIAAELGNPDRATFSRWLRRSASLHSALHSASGTVVSFGAKATGIFYAASRSLGNLGYRWPVYQVRDDGVPEELAELVAIAPRGFVIIASRPLPNWLRGENGRGIFDDVPFFLYDARPQGYLGRLIAHKLANDFALPERLIDWQEQHVMAALTLAGDDNPGAVLVGTHAYERHMRRLLTSPPLPLTGDLANSYEQLARAALADEAPGSSAAGEQPKITAFIDGDPPRHVLVKFSPEHDSQPNSPVAQRWADLLVCEHLAHQVVSKAGFATVRSRIIDGPRRRFLEIERFDRVGALGRRAAISLFAVDAEYFGLLDSWPEAGRRLQARGWLSTMAANTLSFLWQFSALIANTDRHFGNVTLLPQGADFELAPMYDVLPMLFAPQSGELVERIYELPLATPGQFEAWQRALPVAAAFWETAAIDTRISAAFRKLAASCADIVQRAKMRLH
ncbi:MAG: type II toxin-antitoxin system HipA family toxin YjjJ [Deltaproteobacteria bacterium]|nr:type II toxin-antitoxin system HipA family toxin YjjJ [Deltaproteobacteria bacterium]